MYVSELTASMGSVGREALGLLYRKAHEEGLLQAARAPEVV